MAGNSLNREHAGQGMRALLSAFFPFQADMAPQRARRSSVSAPAPRSRGQIRRRPIAAPSPLKQKVCHALAVITLASGLGGLLVAYNMRDTIEVRAQQWVMFFQS